MSVQLILASASPRRKDLLEKIGFSIRCVPADVDESINENENPCEYVKRLARAKILAVVERLKSTNAGTPDESGGAIQVPRAGLKDGSVRWVVGADTIVVLGKEVLGKPRDQDHAFDMLQKLSGQEHLVITGFGVFDLKKNKEGIQAVTSTVKFKKLSRTEIEKYISLGESLDKAGAYAVQGVGTYMIDSVQGSYTNVVGLPLCQFMEMLEEMGARDILPY